MPEINVGVGILPFNNQRFEIRVRVKQNMANYRMQLTMV
jgi:hypothetical protein